MILELIAKLGVMSLLGIFIGVMLFSIFAIYYHVVWSWPLAEYGNGEDSFYPKRRMIKHIVIGNIVTVFIIWVGWSICYLVYLGSLGG